MTEPRQIAVNNELDIVTLRHTVRQVSRSVGLDLPRQAKVTVAISALARAFLATEQSIRFLVRLAHSTTLPMLEIMCNVDNVRSATTATQLENQFNIQEVRMLVDEFHVHVQGASAHVIMRMKLGSTLS